MSAPSGFDPSVSLLQQNASAPIQPFRGGGASLEPFYQAVLMRLSEAEREALPKKIKELTSFKISVDGGKFVLKMRVKGKEEAIPLLPPAIQEALQQVKTEAVQEATEQATGAVQEAADAAASAAESAQEARNAVAEVTRTEEVSADDAALEVANEANETAEAIALVAASKLVAQAIEIREARKDAEILRKAREFLILEAARAFLKAGTAKRKAGKGNSLIKGSNLAKQLERSKIPFLPTQSRQNPTTYSAPTVVGENQAAQQIRGRQNTQPVGQYSESKSRSPSPLPPLSPADKVKKHEAILNANAANRVATNMTKEVEDALNNKNINLNKPKNSNNEATKTLLKDIQDGILELNRVAGEVQTKTMATESATTGEDAEMAASTASEKAKTMRSIQQTLIEKIEQVATIRQRKKVVNNAVAAAAAKTLPFRRGNIDNRLRAPRKRLPTTFNMKPANQIRRLKDKRNANAAASKKVANNAEAEAAAKKRVNNAFAVAKQSAVDQANNAAQTAKDVVDEVETALKTIKIEEQTSNSPATKKVLQHVKESIPRLRNASKYVQQKATETASATTVEEATEAADKANEFGSKAIVIKESILDDLTKVSKARKTTN